MGCAAKNSKFSQRMRTLGGFSLTLYIWRQFCDCLVNCCSLSWGAATGQKWGHTLRPLRGEPQAWDRGGLRTVLCSVALTEAALWCWICSVLRTGTLMFLHTHMLPWGASTVSPVPVCHPCCQRFPLADHGASPKTWLCPGAIYGTGGWAISSTNLCHKGLCPRDCNWGGNLEGVEIGKMLIQGALG